MIDLTKKVLPDSVIVDGKCYLIKTDFHYWLNFGLMLQKNQLKLLTDADFLYDGMVYYKNGRQIDISAKPEDRQHGLDKLMEFYQPKKELPRTTGARHDVIVLDFEKDADYIFAAFYEQYGIDLCSPECHLHWYKFNALLDGLHDVRLTDIMGYRAYDENDKSDYKKSMIKLRQAWEIIPPMTEEEQAELDAFDALLK